MPGEPIRRWLERFFAAAGQAGGTGGIPQTLGFDAEKYYYDFIKMFGFDRPPHEQFIPWLINFFRGNWGRSLAFWPNEVLPLVLTHIPTTLAILVPSLILSFVIGNYLGAYMAFKGGKSDKILLSSMQLLALIPAYWLLIVLFFLFGRILGILPMIGKPIGVIPSLSLGYIALVLKHALLPMITLTLTGIGSWSIGMRTYVIYQLNSNYAKYAKAMGLPDKVIARYAYRNALIPQFTAFAINFGGVFAGSFIIEWAYGYPGMGSLLATFISNQDVFAMQAVFTFTATMLIIANFIADIVYGIIDPRIRRGIVEAVTR